jgi:histidinol-phosphate aminotransferase
MKTYKIENLVRENIKNMKPYSSARDEFTDFDQEMIFLDANENPFENGVNRYPDPQQKSVKELLSKIKNVPANQILLGNGSDEVLDLMFRAFCEPSQDNVITLPPTYGMYGVLANLNAIENRQILLATDFEPDVTTILSKVDAHTKIIFLCSPNNPTTNTFSEEKVLQIIQNFNGLVLLDEAYIDFSQQESWLKRINEFPNLVISQTLSKAYGLAGIRLGVLYASAEIIAVLNKIKPPYNINLLTQQKAVDRLEKIETVQNEIQSILNERDSLIKELGSISFISKIYQSDTNFLLLKVDDANERYIQILDRGIVVRNRTNEALCHNCLRITVGTPKENATLIQVLKSL